MVKDTSKDYETMIGYVAEENLNKSSLEHFLGIEDTNKEYKPEVRKKEPDADFPEDWQHLYVNFRSMEDYTAFMNKIGSKPVPKLKQFIYENPEGQNSGIFGFME